MGDKNARVVSAPCVDDEAMLLVVTTGTKFVLIIDSD